jgi:hypothetical protein
VDGLIWIGDRSLAVRPDGSFWFNGYQGVPYPLTIAVECCWQRVIRVGTTIRGNHANNIYEKQGGEIKMKSFKWMCISMMTIALAIGFSACSSKDATSPQAQTEKEAGVQPAATAMQPSDPSSQTAQSSDSAEATPAAAQPEEAAQATDATDKTDVAEIMGTVLDSDGQIVVFTQTGNYAVTGEDLSAMVGKTVRVRGSLQETEGRPTINVISFDEIK